jgi:hypothetical protein
MHIYSPYMLCRKFLTSTADLNTDKAADVFNEFLALFGPRHYAQQLIQRGGVK